jgi:hypothetical protein
MDIKDLIALLEDTSRNGNIKITKVDYYEGTNYYKDKILKGEIQICVKYEERNDGNDD